jgi:hypothetical protein
MPPLLPQFASPVLMIIFPVRPPAAPASAVRTSREPLVLTEPEPLEIVTLPAVREAAPLPPPALITISPPTPLLPEPTPMYTAPARPLSAKPEPM